MNFNFKIIDLENITSTLMEMRTGIFVLATIAGIHTLTLLCWFGYYNWTNGEPKEIDGEPKKIDEEPKEIDEDTLPILQMEEIIGEIEKVPIDEIVDGKTEIEKQTVEELELIRYNKMLILKKKLSELSEIANMVLNITNKLETTKDELTELNNRSI